MVAGLACLSDAFEDLRDASGILWVHSRVSRVSRVRMNPDGCFRDAVGIL